MVDHVKARTGQRARLSRMIPSLIGRLREGGASVHVTGEKMKRFLDALYELHVAAIRPEGFAKAEGMADRAAEATDDSRKNVFDLAIDAVRGTWFAFDKGNGRWSHARLDWISPMRTTYILAGRARGETIVVTPEDLAWEMSNGRASLVAEPVPLYDRAISAALDFLAAHGAASGAASRGERTTSGTHPAAAPAAEGLVTAE